MFIRYWTFLRMTKQARYAFSAVGHNKGLMGYSLSQNIRNTRLISQPHGATCTCTQRRGSIWRPSLSQQPLSFSNHYTDSTTIHDTRLTEGTQKSEEIQSVTEKPSPQKVLSRHKCYQLDSDGYMKVDDLVDFLQFEGAMDICVIKTSGARSVYVDYFVVVSGMSPRHLRAMSKNLEQLFRGYETRGVGKHGHVTVEGLDSNYWLVVDIGNMVVHFFLPEARELYELEKLWVLGPRFDDQYKAMMEHDEFLQTVYLGDKSKVEEDVKPDES